MRISSPEGPPPGAGQLMDLYLVRAEIDAAQARYGDFSSMHEAYGVLAEEVAELFEAVRLKQDGGSIRENRIRAEAIQVAAVALRIAEQAGRVTR
jgi:NTP pyrophosphatase (non-canonical NTP hydrolase)